MHALSMDSVMCCHLHHSGTYFDRVCTGWDAAIKEGRTLTVIFVGRTTMRTHSITKRNSSEPAHAAGALHQYSPGALSQVQCEVSAAHDQGSRAAPKARMRRYMAAS